MRWLKSGTLIHIGSLLRACMQPSKEKSLTWRPRRRRRRLALPSWQALALGPDPLLGTPYQPGDKAAMSPPTNVLRSMRLEPKLDAILAELEIQALFRVILCAIINPQMR